MEERRTCPLTGIPLPAADAKAVISRDAADAFKNRCNAIPRLMEAAQAALTPSRKDSEGSRSRPGSKPPLSLHALDVLVEAQHIITLWATDLLQNQFPGTALVPGDWDTTAAIYRQADLVHFYPAPDMIQEVAEQLTRLERLAEPPAAPTRITELERLEKLDRLKTAWLTIDKAAQAATLYTGRRLPKRTLYNWALRHRLEVLGEPMRVNMTDVLALHDPHQDNGTPAEVR